MDCKMGLFPKKKWTIPLSPGKLVSTQRKIEVKPLESHGFLLIMSLLPSWALKVVIAVNAGTESSQISSKKIFICVLMNESLTGLERQ